MTVRRPVRVSADAAREFARRAVAVEARLRTLLLEHPGAASVLASGGGLDELALLARAAAAAPEVPEARRLLAEALRLRWGVVMSARRYVGRRATVYARGRTDIEEGDALSAALEGAFEAAKRFDPERGLAFTTYAAIYISYELATALPPAGEEVVGSDGRKVLRRARSLDGQGLTEAQVAERIGTTVERLHEVRLGATPPMPLEPRHHAIPDRRETPDPAEAALIRKRVALLPEEMRQVVELRFGFDGGADERSLTEVGEQLGMDRGKVRRIEALALHALRERLGVAA